VLGDTPLEDAPGYEIFVKTLAGQTLALRVAGTDTVRGLKQRLGKELNLAAERMKLLQGGAFRTEAYSDPTASAARVTEASSDLHYSGCFSIKYESGGFPRLLFWMATLATLATQNCQHSST
jgi:hypothetical protein